MRIQLEFQLYFYWRIQQRLPLNQSRRPEVPAHPVPSLSSHPWCLLPLIVSPGTSSSTPLLRFPSPLSWPPLLRHHIQCSNHCSLRYPLLSVTLMCLLGGSKRGVDHTSPTIPWPRTSISLHVLWVHMIYNETTPSPLRELFYVTLTTQTYLRQSVTFFGELLFR